MFINKQNHLRNKLDTIIPGLGSSGSGISKWFVCWVVGLLISIFRSRRRLIIKSSYQQYFGLGTTVRGLGGTEGEERRGGMYIPGREERAGDPAGMVNWNDAEVVRSGVEGVGYERTVES